MEPKEDNSLREFLAWIVDSIRKLIKGLFGGRYTFIALIVSFFKALNRLLGLIFGYTGFGYFLLSWSLIRLGYFLFAQEVFSVWFVDFLRSLRLNYWPSSYYPDGYNFFYWTFCVIPMVFIFVQNLARSITRTPDFSLWAFMIESLDPKRRDFGSMPPRQLTYSQPQGVVFGRRLGRLVCRREDQPEDGHVLVIGGSGSGKSSAIVIPSLLAWGDQVFVIDIKGELYDITKERRPSVKRFNPMDSDAFGYDPFYILKFSDEIVQDIREIAEILIPKEPNYRGDPIWIDGARHFLTSALLHFYDLEKTFIESVEAIQITSLVKLQQTLEESNSQEAQMFINLFSDLKIETVAGVYLELSSRLMLFATDRKVKAALSKKDVIKPTDLENGQDIFLCLPEDKIDQWATLLTMMVNQFLKHFERRDEKTATPVLFCLEEFPRLGKMEAVKALTTLRSKKCYLMITAQNVGQFDALYGSFNRQTMIGNLSYRAIVNATDPDSQEYFSKLIGTYDKEKESTSSTVNPATGIESSVSTSKTTERRRIIEPEELGFLNREVLLISPYGYTRLRQTRYYETEPFVAWVGGKEKKKDGEAKKEEWENGGEFYQSAVTKISDFLAAEVEKGKEIYVNSEPWREAIKAQFKVSFDSLNQTVKEKLINDVNVDFERKTQQNIPLVSDEEILNELKQEREAKRRKKEDEEKKAEETRQAEVMQKSRQRQQAEKEKKEREAKEARRARQKERKQQKRKKSEESIRAAFNDIDWEEQSKEKDDLGLKKRTRQKRKKGQVGEMIKYFLFEDE